MRTLLISCLLLEIASAQDLARDVRAAIAQKNFALGESIIQDYKGGRGTTPELIEAVSWLGGGALAGKLLGRADGHSVPTGKLALGPVERRQFDAQPGPPP